ncbi:Ig-like domain-containing protein [Heyndrickxia oleronia]|uniref:hypothetical protein n=1 Tax=Heyndrickxia oleronia TaxID=38875 RepID=UPI003750FC00
MRKKQKKWWQRSLALMLSLVLVVSSFLTVGKPVSYAADQETSSGVYVSDKGNDDNGDGTKDTPYATLQKAYQEVSDGGTIYLLDDITLTSVGTNDVGVLINDGKHITISTAPNTETAMIKRDKPTGNMKVLFQLNNKSQLTLRNIIIDGNLEVEKVDGRLFNVYGGSTLIIDKGAILQNSYSRHPGSAIYINDTDSVVEMNGGKISSNKSSLSSMGAAVFIESGAKFIMNGGLIKDNTGGGVESRLGQISLSGDAVITGNINSAGKEQNVNLVKYQALVLAGEFTGEAGITTQSMTPGTKFGRVTDDGLDSIENLIADSGSLVASYDENKTLLWRSFKNELSQPSKDDEILGKRPTLKGVTEPNAKVTIKIVSATDPSLGITKEVTADANGNWVLAVGEDFETGKYAVTVTASKNKTQSEPVTRPFEVGNGVLRTILAEEFNPAVVRSFFRVKLISRGIPLAEKW